jgi:hypothetical protein
VSFAGGAARRVVGALPLPREGTMMDAIKAGAAPSVINQQVREFDNFVEAEHEQMGVLTGVMRRVEDIADRLLGAMPSTDGAGATQPMRAGTFGALLDAHEHRDAIVRRIGDALGRIERVL